MKKTFYALFVIVLFQGAVFLQKSWAKGPSKKEFFKYKREIVLLVEERVRKAHFDFQRTLVMGESRIKYLHENYKIAGSTPPTSLANDLKELRNKSQKIRLLRSRGRSIPKNLKAQELIEKYWDQYILSYEELRSSISLQKKTEITESQLYWEVIKRFKALKQMVREDLIYNTPPGQKSLNHILSRNEWSLLKSIEINSKKTRNKIRCVAAPGENIRSVHVDAGPFYHAAGLLPTNRAQKIGAFSVPVGCRTVTKREFGHKLIYRVSQGKGVAYLGSSEKEIIFGYFTIPPDTAYYFENTTTEPLDLEYIALVP